MSASPQLAGLVPLILSESGSPGAGSAIVLARLADLLFVHALRFWSSTVDASVCGLGAVADPAIGAALRLIHARPAEPWTVERLATSVAMSRSAFAARFTELVGEPPLQYLAHWRMTIAAQRLREDDAVIADVAQAVGYANPVAFSKAFARMQGVGPGTFRRRRHRTATLITTLVRITAARTGAATQAIGNSTNADELPWHPCNGCNRRDAQPQIPILAYGETFVE